MHLHNNVIFLKEKSINIKMQVRKIYIYITNNIIILFGVKKNAIIII